MPFHVQGSIPYLEAAADHFEAEVQEQQQAQAQQQAQQQQQQLQQLGNQLLKFGAIAGTAWLIAKVFETPVVNNLLTNTGQTDDADKTDDDDEGGE